MSTRRKRSLPNQRKVEREYRKKYGNTTLQGRDGGLLPPTIWNYRKSLLFSAASAQDRGIEEGLASRVGPGGYRTNAAVSSDDR